MGSATSGSDLTAIGLSTEGIGNGENNQTLSSTQSGQDSLENDFIQINAGDIETRLGTAAASASSAIKNSTNRQVTSHTGNTERFQGEREHSNWSYNSRSPNDLAGGYVNTSNTPHSMEFGQRSHVSRLSPSGRLSQLSEKEEFQDIFSELMTGTEHEIAFLTRHFSGILGPW